MKKIFILSSLILSTSLFYNVDAHAKTYKIIMGAMKYTPEELTVKKGDKVIWVNKDISTHSSTSKDNTFNSGSIRPKKSWTYTATDIGEHFYKCVFHSGMKGKLTVEE